MADDELHDPWLVAVWPGMGNVGAGAGAYLVQKLGAHLVYELPARDAFEVQHVEVKDGLARVGRLPRSMVFEWRDPQQKHDLLIFLAEAQPPAHGYALCHRLLDYAISRNVTRLYTFAAMATQLHPSDDPRVFGIATDPPMLSQVREQDVQVLNEGQISGLNGVLLAAGAERGVPGVCLMGELPFFAAGVPNPRASQAVLEVFSSLAGITIDLTDIRKQAEVVEKGLLELLEKMKRSSRGEGGEEGFTVPEFATEDADDEDETVPAEPSLDYAARQRIEQLFEAASKDRSRAFELKEELDRLGVFKLYENRFLDLFKKGE